VLKSEYPTGVKFDLAIIDPDVDIADKNIWEKQVQVAIEIKFSQYDSTDNSGDARDDYQKLERYHIIQLKESKNFIGISLLFYHRKEDFQKGAKWMKPEPAQNIQLSYGINGCIIVGLDKGKSEIYTFKPVE
jgi:hypothetical protein